jgi:hypothetical protein
MTIFNLFFFFILDDSSRWEDDARNPKRHDSGGRRDEPVTFGLSLLLRLSVWLITVLFLLSVHHCFISSSPCRRESGDAQHATPAIFLM